MINIYTYILIEMRKKDIEKIVGASSARMEKNASTRTRTEILQLTRLIAILLHFNQFISSLAALVYQSDRGGPVGEAEKAKVASVSRTRSSSEMVKMSSGS